jgi:hypothetical protein
MGWAAMVTVILPMLMQSCQNGASIAKYDPVSTFTNGCPTAVFGSMHKKLYEGYSKETHWLSCMY